MKRWLYLKYRSLKWILQKLFWGFSDLDCINLDHHLSKVILSRLERFRYIHKSYPSGLTSDQWNDILDEMIWAFKTYYSEDIWDLDSQAVSRINNGMDLFRQYYMTLWS